MTVEDLKDHLASNPEMLERYVLETISLETLEKWLQRKAERLNLPIKPVRGKNKLAKWKVGEYLYLMIPIMSFQYSVNTDKRNMLEDLTSNLISKPNNKARQNSFS